MVRYPDGNDLRRWADGLRDTWLVRYLPGIDESWYTDMLSAFETTAIRPDCRDNACRAAAVAFHKIIKNHYRVDGNKRSAVLCAYLLFSINALHLDIDVDDLYEKARGIAQSTADVDALLDDIERSFAKSCKTL